LNSISEEASHYYLKNKTLQWVDKIYFWKRWNISIRCVIGIPYSSHLPIQYGK
jgi:hypothetical protein